MDVKRRSAFAIKETNRVLPHHGVSVFGRVASVSGLAVDVAGLAPLLSVGDRITLESRDGRRTRAEIVGFRGGHAQAMTFGPLDGIGPGSSARYDLRGVAREAFGRGATLPVARGWIGRVIDPLGRPLDGKGPLAAGPERRVRADPPEATVRARLGPRIDLGVRALDVFATCRQGQRLGLFAGSGIGKSTLLAMLARNTACDVAVLALVGERGREVREFLEDDLGAAGLARSVVVVATSDSPPLQRREAALAAVTIAEHFRDEGLSVLLLMDSVTRYCLALREIGLAAGEPPRHPRLSAERVRRTAAPARARGARPGAGRRGARRADNRHVHRFGGGRRS